MRHPKATIDPNADPKAVADYLASLRPAQRLALLRRTQRAELERNVSSAERVAENESSRDWAKNV